MLAAAAVAEEGVVVVVHTRVLARALEDAQAGAEAEVVEGVKTQVLVLVSGDAVAGVEVVPEELPKKNEI